MTYPTIGDGDAAPIDLPTDDLLTFRPLGWYWPQGGARITIRPDGSSTLTYNIGGTFNEE